MDKFLKTLNLWRLNHEKIENLKRPVTTKQIDQVKMLPNKKKSPRQDEVSLVKITEYLKKNKH